MGHTKTKRIDVYLLETQAKYLQTRDPLDLAPLTHDDVAIAAGYRDASYVTKYLNTHAVTLPDGERIPARKLVPGHRIHKIKSDRVFDELSGDPTIYNGGKWLLSDQKIVPVFEKRNLPLARRTIHKHRKAWEKSHPYLPEAADLEAGSEAVERAVHL